MSKKLDRLTILNLLHTREDGNLFHRESQTLEFKESFNLAGLGEYYRDFCAFANNKGGYLIFGVKDRPKRELIGMSNKAIEQFDKLDPETVSGHLLDIFSGDITWEHEIFTLNNLTFGVFYIYESKIKPIICKKDEGKDNILKNGEIYYRYGGRTQKIQYAELENIINRRIEVNNQQWLDLVQKIGKAGPRNAAILDVEQGLIEKGASQILMIDQSLLQQIQWIREGEFSEKKGERTLKLIGEVQPIDKVEIIKKVKENRLKEYPLTAKELVSEVKKEHPYVKQNRIYGIIQENGLKDNKEYSTYVFRSIKQETEYESNGTLPKGITSIYKHTVVDYIKKIITSEKSQ